LLGFSIFVCYLYVCLFFCVFVCFLCICCFCLLFVCLFVFCVFVCFLCICCFCVLFYSISFLYVLIDVFYWFDFYLSLFLLSVLLFPLCTVPDCNLLFCCVFWFSESNLAHSYLVPLCCVVFPVPCSPEASQVRFSWETVELVSPFYFKLEN